MAIIILEPRESFEHYHSDASKTYHVNGDVEISIKGKKMILEKGESVEVPGNTAHTIVNLGDDEARVGCLHVVNSAD